MRASDGVKRIDVAIERGRKAITDAVSLFQGTVPPPPFPSPELYQAIGEAKDVRSRLQTLADAGDADFDPTLPKVKFIAQQVESKALAVERLAAKLEGKREIVATATPAAAIAKVKRMVNAPTMAFVGLAALFLLEGRKRK